MKLLLICLPYSVSKNHFKEKLTFYCDIGHLMANTGCMELLGAVHIFVYRKENF